MKRSKHAVEIKNLSISWEEIKVLRKINLNLIEGEKSGYANIPISIYWAIVTMTTVGYGDIVPITPLGQVVSSFIMLIGYSMLAVPTGIITSELSSAKKNQKNTISCAVCDADELDINSKFCFKCGALID